MFANFEFKFSKKSGFCSIPYETKIAILSFAYRATCNAKPAVQRAHRGAGVHKRLAGRPRHFGPRAPEAGASAEGRVEEPEKVPWGNFSGAVVQRPLHRNLTSIPAFFPLSSAVYSNLLVIIRFRSCGGPRLVHQSSR